VQGWNNITVTLWTHERGGLTEADFEMAARIDAVDKADLISKKPPQPW
jgi:4a-hydroxytetrahydrobiopterin dehydratase